MRLLRREIGVKTRIYHSGALTTEEGLKSANGSCWLTNSGATRATLEEAIQAAGINLEVSDTAYDAFGGKTSLRSVHIGANVVDTPELRQKFFQALEAIESKTRY